MIAPANAFGSSLWSFNAAAPAGNTDTGSGVTDAAPASFQDVFANTLQPPVSQAPSQDETLPANRPNESKRSNESKRVNESGRNGATAAPRKNTRPELTATATEDNRVELPTESGNDPTATPPVEVTATGPTPSGLVLKLADQRPATATPPAAASVPNASTSNITATQASPAPAQQTGLAFALRVHPTASKSNPATGSGASSATASGTASGDSAGTAVSPSSALTHSLAAPASPTMLSASHSGLPSAFANTPTSSRTSGGSADSSQPSASTQSLSEPPTTDAQPLRSVHVQLAGDDNQRVDLRLVEHAGALAVSVRTSNSGLTRGLQEHLPELTARLAAERYRAEAWLPAAATGTGGGRNESGGSSTGDGQSGAGKQLSQGGNGGSPGGQPGREHTGRDRAEQDQTGQKQGGQSQPPTWLQQLAAFAGTPKQTN